MRTLTDQELRQAPQALLDFAQRLECTLVTTDGQPVLMAVPLANGRPPAGRAGGPGGAVV